MTDSMSRALVIVLRSRLWVFVFVFVIFLLECRWSVRLLVRAESVVALPPSPLALQPTSLGDGLTVTFITFFTCFIFSFFFQFSSQFDEISVCFRQSSSFSSFVA